MKRASFLPAALGLLVASFPLGTRAEEVSTLRGSVVDEKGQPIPGVTIELEYKGESRTKIVRKATTDKKGAFIRVGLKSGPWSLVFSKEGFRSGKLDTNLTFGGISEIPPVTLSAGTAAAAGGGPAAPGGPPAPGAPASAPAPVSEAEAAARQAEYGKQLMDRYNKAVDAMRAGQGAEAEALFKSILAEVPNLAAAHHNLGYIYTQRNDAAAAEAAFRKAIELRPEAGESYTALSTLLGAQKRLDEALQLLQEAAPRFATDAPFQFALGATAFNLGKGAEAEAAFKKVTELDPANSEVQFYLGSVALNRNDVPAAIAHFEKYAATAAEGAPNLAAAKALLATLKKTK
jgi:Tfp pilus assembly protein PilF